MMVIMCYFRLTLVSSLIVSSLLFGMGGRCQVLGKLTIIYSRKGHDEDGEGADTRGSPCEVLLAPQHTHSELQSHEMRCGTPRGWGLYWNQRKRRNREIIYNWLSLYIFFSRRRGGGGYWYCAPMLINSIRFLYIQWNFKHTVIVTDWTLYVPLLQYWDINMKVG